MGCETWKIEEERVKQRDATILKGMEAGIDDIAEKQAHSMCFDHPGMVFPRVNRHIFAEVKACIAAAILEAMEKKGAIY